MLGADADLAMEATEASAPEPEAQGDHELSPREWRAWEVFDACWTNWRVIAGLGDVYWQGLDYAAVDVAMRMVGVSKKHWRDVFWMVRVLEDEARVWRNKQR